MLQLNVSIGREILPCTSAAFKDFTLVVTFTQCQSQKRANVSDAIPQVEMSTPCAKPGRYVARGEAAHAVRVVAHAEQQRAERDAEVEAVPGAPLQHLRRRRNHQRIPGHRAMRHIEPHEPHPKRREVVSAARHARHLQQRKLCVRRALVSKDCP